MTVSGRTLPPASGRPLPRLYVAEALVAGAELTLGQEAANYLGNVLRLGPGDALLVFDGLSGEWRATILEKRKRDVRLALEAMTRPQPPAADLLYCFAPLKAARLDYMVQKATEMGASVLQPVMTHRTQPGRVNTERMRANAVEAAEQCGILAIPAIREPVTLERLVADWPAGRLLVFCDEEAPIANPLAALSGRPRGPLGVLIGPEGGFDAAERALLKARPFTLAISLGPRILRADTAAVAALAAVQATLGDWG